jgi:polysaccharide pyruvyl transferase WcaK-like protein
MKNKIGILTFIWSVNYGAKLQAWALQSVISSLGYDCELINFKRRQDKRISESLRHMKQGKIVQCVRELMLELLNLQKNMRFNAFTKNYIKLSPQKCFNLKGLRKISDRYDAIICGSDQVWNPAHAQDSQLAYLLDISSKKEIRRISYAASIGRDALDKSWELTFSRCLKKFDAISIREKSAVDLIKQLADKETPIVLDPTLLLTQEQWAQQCASVEINEPYLLVYSTGPESPPIFKKLVERCAKERGLRIVTFQKRKRFHN